MKTKAKSLVTLLSIFISLGKISAQTTFEVKFGTPPVNDYGNSVQQTPDGGYVLVGSELIKTDANGVMQWTNNIRGNEIKLTLDGGYIIVGDSLIKTDAIGNRTWAKWLSGNAVGVTSDSGYVVTGANAQFVRLTKVNSSGSQVWDQIYLTMQSGQGWSVQETTDGGFIIAGTAYSFSLDSQVLLIKTDSAGNELWKYYFGNTSYSDEGWSMQQTTDGGYIIAGENGSGVSSFVVTLLKTDGNGILQWYKTYGDGPGLDDGGWSVIQSADGGYAIAGFTESYGNGARDVYFIKTDANGNSVCEKTFGGTDDDNGYYIGQTSDGNYIIAGNADYNNTTYLGDIYLIKTDDVNNCGVSAVDSKNNVSDGSLVCFPNPSNGHFTLQGNYALPAVLVLYDLTGRRVYQQQVTSNQQPIDMRGYAKGMYVVKLVSNEETHIRKLILE